MKHKYLPRIADKVLKTALEADTIVLKDCKCGTGEVKIILPDAELRQSRVTVI